MQNLREKRRNIGKWRFDYRNVKTKYVLGAVALAIVFQLFFRYSYVPLGERGAVLRTDRLTGVSCLWVPNASTYDYECDRPAKPKATDSDDWVPATPLR
jgi:hypothetical protein